MLENEVCVVAYSSSNEVFTEEVSNELEVKEDNNELDAEEGSKAEDDITTG
jgi:hypothetical protein